MTRVLYFWGGKDEASNWDLIHGGEGEVLVYGETGQVPRVGDFVFLQSGSVMDQDVHRYWANVSAVQWVAYQPSFDIGEQFTTEARVFLDRASGREQISGAASTGGDAALDRPPDGS